MNEIAKELLDALHDCEGAMSEITKELLEALKSIMALPDHKVDRRDEAKAARAAIAKAESALATLAAPQPADDGWIPWAGGERPVDTIVAVRLRNGGIIMNFACIYDWRHIKDPVDIVAYRVVKP